VPLLRVRACRWCQRLFFPCRACDRGHAYCSPSCRRAGRVQSLRAAGRRYQASPEGRLEHRDRQRAYRARCRLRVTHQASTLAESSAILGAPQRPRVPPTDPPRGHAEVLPCRGRAPGGAARPRCELCGRPGRVEPGGVIQTIRRPDHDAALAPDVMMLTSIPNRVLPLFRSTALTAACEAHLQHLADRHYAETTCAVRRVHLRLFCTWAAAHGVTHAEWLTRAVREAYRHHLLECRKPDGAPLSLASQHSRLTHLRVWCAWLVREQYLPADPAVRLELPRVESRLPAVCSATEGLNCYRLPSDNVCRPRLLSALPGTAGTVPRGPPAAILSAWRSVTSYTQRGGASFQYNSPSSSANGFNPPATSCILQPAAHPTGHGVPAIAGSPRAPALPGGLAGSCRKPARRRGG
jgi:hypothetical protein